MVINAKTYKPSMNHERDKAEFVRNLNRLAEYELKKLEHDYLFGDVSYLLKEQAA